MLISSITRIRAIRIRANQIEDGFWINPSFEETLKLFP